MKLFLQKFARYRFLYTVLLFILITDQISKVYIRDFSSLTHNAYPPFGGMVIIQGFLNIVYTTNEGAAWGILSGYGNLLSLMAVVALMAIFFYRKHLGLAAKYTQCIFGLICGGILGNFLDRVFYGRVTDFIDVLLPGYRWPTFNIADSAITVGALLYVILVFREEYVNGDKPNTGEKSTSS